MKYRSIDVLSGLYGPIAGHMIVLGDTHMLIHRAIHRLISVGLCIKTHTKLATHTYVHTGRTFWPQYFICIQKTQMS